MRAKQVTFFDAEFNYYLFRVRSTADFFRIICTFRLTQFRYQIQVAVVLNCKIECRASIKCPSFLATLLLVL